MGAESWEVNTWGGLIEVEESDPDGRCIAHGIDTVEHAALIAAAPDLLAACEEADQRLAELAAFSRGERKPIQGEIYLSVADVLKAAIAAAKGGS